MIKEWYKTIDMKGYELLWYGDCNSVKKINYMKLLKAIIIFYFLFFYFFVFVFFFYF